jgi:hypothetical protein
MNLFRFAFAGLVLAGAGGLAQAKPIAFAHGTTVMAEYGAGTMTEAQVFYAPKYLLSLGGGYLRARSDVNDQRREITYARVNYLVKRWNLESAQANVFTGAVRGQAYVSESNRIEFAGMPARRSTTRRGAVYASLQTDLHRSNVFEHRIDTLQLGIAPYKHDFDTLATWFVVQGRQYTGGIHDAHRVGACCCACFKRGAWIEAGRLPTKASCQAMAMVNF